MTAPDFEAEYNNRARVPEHPGIIAGWKENAAAYRASHKHAELGLAYGPSARQTIDLFWSDASRDTPIVLFIHGGYWQALDPSYFSHLARAANVNGIAFAVAGYDLCPQVSVSDIVDQVRAAALYLWRRHQRPHGCKRPFRGRASDRLSGRDRLEITRRTGRRSFHRGLRFQDCSSLSRSFRPRSTAP